MPLDWRNCLKVGSFRICGEIGILAGSLSRLGPNIFFTLSGSARPFDLKKVKTPGSKRICGGRSSILTLALTAGFGAGAGAIAGAGAVRNRG